MAIESTAAAIAQERLTATWSAAVGRSDYMPILERRAARCTDAAICSSPMASENFSANVVLSAAAPCAATIATSGERPAFAWLSGGRRARSSAASATDTEPNGNFGASRCCFARASASALAYLFPLGEPFFRPPAIEAAKTF